MSMGIELFVVAPWSNRSDVQILLVSATNIFVCLSFSIQTCFPLPSARGIRQGVENMPPIRNEKGGVTVRGTIGAPQWA